MRQCPWWLVDEFNWLILKIICRRPSRDKITVDHRPFTSITPSHSPRRQEAQVIAYPSSTYQLISAELQYTADWRWRILCNSNLFGGVCYQPTDKNYFPSRSHLLVKLKGDLGNLNGRRSRGAGGTFRSVSPCCPKDPRLKRGGLNITLKFVIAIVNPMTL